MLLQRIECDEGSVHGHAKFEPSPIVVKSLCKGGRRISSASLTQHATSKERLQLAGLLILPGREDKVDAHSPHSPSLYDVQGYAIAQDVCRGFTKRERRRLYDGGDGSVKHKQTFSLEAERLVQLLFFDKVCHDGLLLAGVKVLGDIEYLLLRVAQRLIGIHLLHVECPDGECH